MKRLGKSLEDYLETMLILKEKNGYIRSVDIAEHMNVSKPSVSIATKRLRENGYIDMDHSGFITLTDTGFDVANQVYTKHKTLIRFFTMLGVSLNTASEDACKIEHDISDETFRAICNYINKTPQ